MNSVVKWQIRYILSMIGYMLRIRTALESGPCPLSWWLRSVLRRTDNKRYNVFLKAILDCHSKSMAKQPYYYYDETNLSRPICRGSTFARWGCYVQPYTYKVIIKCQRVNRTGARKDKSYLGKCSKYYADFK